MHKQTVPCSIICLLSQTSPLPKQLEGAIVLTLPIIVRITQIITFYIKIAQFPLGMELESNLLLIQGSMVDNVDSVVITEQTVENYDFGDGGSFNVDWE